ncbi:MAG: hypothetical protein EA344_07490 [Alkalicoccus sp.]|nr:MAG: hypothetical protein EA344_07490 [Alkalicoccus sp.]
MKSLNEQISQTMQKLHFHNKWSTQVERLNELLMKNQVRNMEIAALLKMNDSDLKNLHSMAVSDILAEAYGSSAGDRENTINKVLYVETVRRSEELEKEKRMYENHAAGLGNVEDEYEQLSTRAEELIKLPNTVWSRELYETTKEEVVLGSQLQDLSEALDAAQYASQSITALLKTTENIPDISINGSVLDSLLLDAAEKSLLEENRELLHQTARRLRQFLNELEQTGIDNTSLPHSNFSQQTEQFYETFVRTWIGGGNRPEAVNNVLTVQNQIATFTEELKNNRSAAVKKKEEASLKRVGLISRA